MAHATAPALTIRCNALSSQTPGVQSQYENESVHPLKTHKNYPLVLKISAYGALKSTNREQ
jgi:hypothetical protein